MKRRIVAMLMVLCMCLVSFGTVSQAKRVQYTFKITYKKFTKGDKVGYTFYTKTNSKFKYAIGELDKHSKCTYPKKKSFKGHSISNPKDVEWNVYNQYIHIYMLKKGVAKLYKLNQNGSPVWACDAKRIDVKYDIKNGKVCNFSANYITEYQEGEAFRLDS